MTVHTDSFIIVYFVYYNTFIIPSTFVRYVYTSDIMYTGKLQLNLLVTCEVLCCMAMKMTPIAHQI